MARISDTIAQLGKDIVAKVKAGDDKGREDYCEAGRLLIQARDQIDSKAFNIFLRDHCKLSRTRAYELIAIAGGKTTAEELRAKSNARKKKHRANLRGNLSVVRSGTDASTTKAEAPKLATRDAELPSAKSQRALAEFKCAVDAYFRDMDDETKHEAVAYATQKATVVKDRAA